MSSSDDGFVCLRVARLTFTGGGREGGPGVFITLLVGHLVSHIAAIRALWVLQVLHGAGELEVIYGTAGCSYRIQCSRLNWLSRPSRVNNGDSVGGREETTKGEDVKVSSPGNRLP